MADNVTLLGEGEVVATDQVGAAHYQKIKLFDATTDSTAATGVAANPLRVDPTGTTTQPVNVNQAVFAEIHGNADPAQVVCIGASNGGAVEKITSTFAGAADVYVRNAALPTGGLISSGSGTFTAAGQTITLATTVVGYSGYAFSIQGTYSGFTFVLEQATSSAPTNWFSCPFWQPTGANPTIHLSDGGSSVTRLYNCSIPSGQLRMRCTALGSGTVNVEYSRSTHIPPPYAMVVGQAAVSMENAFNYAYDANWGLPFQHVGGYDQYTTDVSMLNFHASQLITRPQVAEQEAGGSITGTAQSVTLSPIVYKAIAVFVSGTYAGVNLTFEFTADGSNWVGVSAARLDTGAYEATTGALTNTSRAWKITVPSAVGFRVRSTAHSSGTMNVSIIGYPHFVDPTPIAYANQAGTWNVGLSAGSNNIGDVDVVSSVWPTLTSAANVARGKIVGTSLTGSYATLLSMGGVAKHLSIFNSCDQAVYVSFDAGTTDTLELDAGEYFSCDYASLGMQVASSTIQAKHAGTVPASGSIRAVIVR